MPTSFPAYETVVLGGIRSRSESQEEDGIPFLSRIPVLGWLFEKTARQEQQSELFIFITPTIVTDQFTTRQARRTRCPRSNGVLPPHFYLTPRLFLSYYSAIMEPGRREFIKRALAWVLALLGLGFLLPGLRVLSPAVRQEKELVYFPLVDEGEVPRSGVKKVELSFTAAGKERKTRVFIVSSPGGLAVFSAVCSHLGCLVNYRKEKREFVCPCHGGRYDLSGKNIAGPPPAPLTRLPAKVEKGMVMVGVKV